MSEPLDQLEELDENDLLYEKNLHDATVKLKETNLLDKIDQAVEPYQDEAAAVIPKDKPTHQLGQSDKTDQPSPSEKPVIPEEDKYGAKKKTFTKAESEKTNKKNKRKHKKNKDKKPEEVLASKKFFHTVVLFHPTYDYSYALCSQFYLYW